MAGGHTRRSSQDGSIFGRNPTRRRSSSQGDETPRVGLLQSANSSSNADASAGHASAESHPSKRLGFLPEKLLSSSSGGSSSLRTSPGGIHLRTHARADSAHNGISREATSSPTPGMTSTHGQPKGHISPTKTSSARTYDSKLVTREMHRLGTLAHSHLPALGPSLTAAAQAATAIAAPVMPSLSANSSDPWQSLHVHVLPLFNGEPLRVPIEDLNQLVKRHIQAVVSQSPSKALAVLENDASELIASGMVTLNAKLAEIDDEKLVGRVVELWGFFWDQVLPYVEGALLPLQTEPLLSSLYRHPKTHKQNTSPISGTNGKGSISSLVMQSSSQIDVRTVALQSFRDRVIDPVHKRMSKRIEATREDSIPESPISSQPRLQQMLLVLVSQRSRRPISFSLTPEPQEPTAGEAAVQLLLRAVCVPLAQTGHGARRSSGAPSFLSAGQPRDRRGRIAQKHERRSSGARRESIDEEDEGSDGAGNPPRARFAVLDDEIRQQKDFLDSLRSPGPEATPTTGGWGLGVTGEGKAQEDDDDDTMDWDQAQAVVERMVGMNTLQDSRRRGT